jgi:hypothetical protein
MTFTKATTLSIGLVGAFAIGVWTGPSLTQSFTSATTPQVAQVDQAPAMDMDAPRPAARVAPPAPQNPFDTAMAASDPSVQRHAQSLLNDGANVQLASEGFRDAELFVSVAYAARNTEIPFVLLKHRVLTEGRTLSDAIRVSKPELDSMREMDRARTEARSVIARLGN